MAEITAHEIELIRDAANELLFTTCSIYNTTLVSDGLGGQTESAGTIGLNVACDLFAESHSIPTLDSGGKIVYKTDWKLQVPYDQAIASGNYVVIAGDTYDVKAVEDDDPLRFVRTAYLVRRDGS